MCFLPFLIQHLTKGKLSTDYCFCFLSVVIPVEKPLSDASECQLCETSITRF